MNAQARIEQVARVLLDTADVHDLGWNNLATTARAVVETLEQNDATLAAAIETTLRDTTACACSEAYCASRNGAASVREAVRAVLREWAL